MPIRTQRKGVYPSLITKFGNAAESPLPLAINCIISSITLYTMHFFGAQQLQDDDFSSRYLEQVSQIQDMNQKMEWFSFKDHCKSP